MNDLKQIIEDEDYDTLIANTIEHLAKNNVRFRSPNRQGKGKAQTQSMKHGRMDYR